MYLGIEIGGTKLQLGLGPGDGTILAIARRPVDVGRGPDGIREQILETVPALLSQCPVPPSALQGVGIGFGGPVDDTTHRIIKSHQIAGWDDFPLAEWLGNFLHLPAVLGNDADVAGLAEALFGAGRGMSPVFYMTIGSGIGGGLIIDGQIFRGCGRGAAEIGHLQMPDELAGSGAFVLEDVASGWSMQGFARDRLRAKPELPSSLRRKVGGVNTITSEDIGLAAAAGDEFANSIIERELAALAWALTQALTLFSPRRLVIGGGVSLLGEKLLFEPLRALVARRVFKPFAECYDIVPAQLGEAVVVHGALALARKKGVRNHFRSENGS